MTSAAQLAANQANAQKSTGPKTEEGKQKARIVARRHGLTGQFYALSAEDSEAFSRHEAALKSAYQPEGIREELLVTAIAQDTWRLNRAAAIENNIFALAHQQQEGNVDASSAPVHTAVTLAQTWLRDAHNFQLLALYESRLRRAVEKNEAQLRSLQLERKAARAAALEEALLLARLARMKRETFDPQANGFEFSAAELTAILHRHQSLAQAKLAQKHGWNPRALRQYAAA